MSGSELSFSNDWASEVPPSREEPRRWIRVNNFPGWVWVGFPASKMIPGMAGEVIVLVPEDEIREAPPSVR